MSLRYHATIARQSVLAGLILAGGIVLLSGCVRMELLPNSGTGLVLPEGKPRPVRVLNVPHEKDPTKIYRIGPRDILRVDVRKDPTLSSPVGYVVTDEGNILLPNLGPVQVANLTTSQIEQKLNEILAQYIRDPDAKVGVQTYNSKIVNVMGQVGRPGPVIMRADMLTLQEAVVAAGLPSADAAIQRTRVITPDMEHPIVRQIDLTDILYKGRMRENILLKPNDIVYVPSRYGSNLTETLRELLQPADQVLGFATQLSYITNNSNNNGKNSSNNLPISTSTTGTGTTTGH